MRTEARTVLKASVKRTVSLERSSVGGAGRVIKRFHAPASIRAGAFIARAMAGLGDRRRALGEARALQAARQADLPVPEVLGCEKVDGRWELTTSAIPGARPLVDVLEDTFSRPEKGAALDELADGLASLARRSIRLGFLHADPHPANVLVDESGKLWIVDVARSRTGAGRRRVEASLIRALSRLRELTPSTFRLRMARAYFDGRPDAAWIKRAEARAICERVDELEARVAVWRRSSSATEVRAVDDGRSVVHVRARSGAAASGWRAETITGSPAEIDAIWSTLVRAKLHGVPGAEPKALALDGASRWIEVEVPDLEPPLSDPHRLGPAPEDIDRLQGQLRRRGLTISNVDGALAVLRSPGGGAIVGPAARLAKLYRGDPST